MEIGESPIDVIPEPGGKKRYEVEGTGVVTAWKKFEPSVGDASTPESEKKNKAIIFLPGWSITEQAKSIETLCQTFADQSHSLTYAVDTRAEQIVSDSLSKEAEAVRQFITERGLEEVTVVGNSLGGAEAIHLVAHLQEKNPQLNIDGLILLDSMSLYEQSGFDLATNYAKDMINTRMSLRNPPQMRGRDEIALQNSNYLKDGTVETLKEVMRSHLKWPKRTINEIQGMVKANPHLSEIKAPIVMIQGADDLLSNPAKIIPNPEVTNKEAPYIENIHEREEFLKENVFTKSPYIRMIVPEKMGHHNVSYSRPASVAESALYLLHRYHRQNTAVAPAPSEE